MRGADLPKLVLAEWQPTRNKLQDVARLLERVRATLAPAQRHWWHITLHCTATGLTTTPMPAGDRLVELSMDLTRHELLVAASDGRRSSVLLSAPLAVLRDEVLAEMARLGAEVDLADLIGPDAPEHDYNAHRAAAYWQMLIWTDTVFREFGAGLRGDTSPVHLFPHHFDLALTWLSGRSVPGADPQDEEAASEQMTFGFLTGDEHIPAPYIYVLVHPFPERLPEVDLPAGGYWNDEGFRGAVLPFDRLREAEDPRSLLLEFLQTVQARTARLLLDSSG